MKNIIALLFSNPDAKPAVAKRVRNKNGMYAKKVKIGGMYTGHFYTESRKGFKAQGGRIKHGI